MKLITSLVAVLILYNIQLYGIIIVTHGFTRDNRPSDELGLYEPAGNIYETLRKQGAFYGHEIKFFEWKESKYSGLKTKNYKEIGKELAREIIDYAKIRKFGTNQKIVLIGIGYGGIICYHASQFLGKQIRTPDFLKKLMGLSITDQIPSINQLFIFGMPYILDRLIEDTTSYEAVEAIYNVTSFTEKQLSNAAMATALVPPCFYPGLQNFSCINVQDAKGDVFHGQLPSASMAEHIFKIADFAKKHPPHTDFAECTCTTPHAPLRYTITE